MLAQGHSLVKPTESLVQSLIQNNADFGGFVGEEGVIFFNENLQGPYHFFKENWDTQKWSRGY